MPFALFKNRFFLLLLAIINFVVGVYAAVTFYSADLFSANPVFWVFIALCPLYTLLLGVALLLRAANKPKTLLSFIAIVGSVKYVLWTLFVLFLMGEFLSLWWIILAHLLLLVETIVFVRVFAFKLKHFLICVLWFVLTDFVNYGLLAHPYFDTSFFSIVAVFSVVLSLILPLIVSILFSTRIVSASVSPKKKEVVSRFAHKK